MPTTHSLRIDKLPLGATITLRFGRGADITYEDAIFLGIKGEGDTREASFMQLHDSGAKLFTWEAYRYHGRWVYGSSADPVAVEEIKHAISTGRQHMISTGAQT